MRSLPTDQKSLAPLNRGLIVTTTLTALVVAAVVFIGLQNRGNEAWVRHSLTVRSNLLGVVGAVRDADLAQRGYLLTGRSLYLAPYTEAVEAIPQRLDQLSVLVSDNPHQSQELAQLRHLATEKLDELRFTIKEDADGHRDAALSIVNNDKGFQLMQGIHQSVALMLAEEDRLLASRQLRAAWSSTLLLVGGAIALLAIFILAFLISHYTRRSVAAIAAARDQLIVSNEELVEQISRREQVERQLRQSQKMEALGQLTGGIAHDFNNMLGVILGSLDLIRRRVKNGDFGVERFIDAASNAGERAAVLTQRLLAFARQQPLAPQPLNANKMIVNMSDLLRSTLGEQIRIESVAAAGLWNSPRRCSTTENAILNIAVNARDAMPEGGKMTIETGNAYLDEAYCRQNPEIEPGKFVMIAISDTGTGMPPGVIARAFDPFFTTKATGKGTGLGLSQVYGFVKQSKGHIKIYSESRSGTTVKMYFPRHVGDAPEEESARRPNRCELVIATKLSL